MTTITTKIYDDPDAIERDGTRRIYSFKNGFGAQVDVMGDAYVLTPMRYHPDGSCEMTTLTRVSRVTIGSPAHVELKLREIQESPQMPYWRD